jgi:competence protein ComEC
MLRLERKKIIVIFMAILACLNILAWKAVFSLDKKGILEVDFFDVGQGDSALILTPQFNKILIDGGPDNSVLEKLGKAVPFWDRTLDLIILTHPEADHMAGLIEVLKRYKVENILWNGVVRDTAEYLEWKNLAENEGANIFIAKRGEKITLGKTVLDVLSPQEFLDGQNFKDSNDTSIVVRIVFGGNSFLFTGDVTNKGEEAILQKGDNLASDILKVAHHGSKTSSLEDFIKEISPKIAVISAGKDNKYGLPAPEILDELEKYAINILRTDEKGDIVIFSDGKNLEFK